MQVADAPSDDSLGRAPEPTPVTRDVSTEVFLDRLRASLAGRYEVQRELGRGGFATVYLASDVRHGRMVAIKVLHPELMGTLQSERFLREIRVVAHLNHPHILPMLDSGEADGLLFFVMPYVEGETLRDFLDRENQLSIREALRITAEIADGLAYAHARGLVHRDIKPENILLSSGHAVVTDFGIGRAIDQSAAERLTYTGMATGSPAYMSPEQWTTSDRVDGRADEYSLACVLYEMLVGETPFSGTSASALMARHSVSPVPSVRVVRPNVPEAVDEAIARAMEKIPADRFPTITGFAEALAAAPAPVRVTVEDPLRPSVERTKPRRVRLTRANVGLILGVILAGAGGYVALKGLLRAPGETRLAVLPFENLGAGEDAFLVDGITGELTNQLSGIRSLAVIARTSAFQYRNSQKRPREIGRELKVQYLIEGSVRRKRTKGDQDSVEVNARLIRANDDTQVWSDKYAVEASDLGAMQSRIAERVTAKLDVMLLKPERRRLATRPTTNVQAHEYYLRGNEYYGRSWSRPDVEAAVQMYEKAVETDPEYALAYARLAQAHTWVHQLRYDLSEDRLVAAKRAADRAVALDPELSAARVALGLYYYWGRSNYERAIQEFTIAQDLQPSNAEVSRQIANVQRRQGRFSDAIANYRKAADLDPRSHQTWFNLGETLLFIRDYAAARPDLERATTLAPEFLEGYVQQARLAINARGDLATAQRILRQAEERIPPTAWRAAMHEFARIIYHPDLDQFLERIRPGAYGLDSATYHTMKGTMLLQTNRRDAATRQFDSARVHLERMRENQPDQAWIHGLLGLAYAGAGRGVDAIQAAERAEQLLPVSRDHLDGPEWVINLGRVHAMLGNDEKAVEYFARALAVPSWISANSLRVDPVLAPLKSNPGFKQLVGEP
jgi:eukaryotic-like serine/threonine-protein kinase